MNKKLVLFKQNDGRVAGDLPMSEAVTRCAAAAVTCCVERQGPNEKTSKAKK